MFVYKIYGKYNCFNKHVFVLLTAMCFTVKHILFDHDSCQINSIVDIPGTFFLQFNKIV